MSSDRFERQSEHVPRDRMPEMVTVIGCGAIGRNVALQLAAIGVPKLQLFDFDTVEEGNLCTQGWAKRHMDWMKVTALGSVIDDKYAGEVYVEEIGDRYRPKYTIGDAVFCCVDSITAREKIWRSVRKSAKFWCDGRMMGETGQVYTSTVPEVDQFYDTTLFSQDEAYPGRCTARSTIYCAQFCANLMIHQFTRWLRRIECDRKLCFNLLASEMWTE